MEILSKKEELEEAKKQLHACPFCGNEEIRILEKDEFHAYCSECQCGTEWKGTLDELIETWNKKVPRDLETVDEVTNVVMDIIRDKIKINADSDEDDNLYGLIHTAVREELENA